MPERVVFLGGGVSTLVALRRLREGPPELQDKLQITIINRDEWHYMPPLFADFALGEVREDQLKAPVANIAKRYGAELIIDEVVDVDPAKQQLKTKGGKTIEYDYLFIGSGVSYDHEAVPGLSRYGYHNYSLEGAKRMREALSKFKGGRVVMLVPGLPFRCGCYPFEMAGKLKYFAMRKDPRSEVHLVTVFDEKQMGQMFKDVFRQFRRIHNKLGIIYHPGKEAKEVREKEIVFTDGSTLKYDLLIYVPPVKVPEFAKNRPELVCPNNKKVLATTYPEFRNPKYRNVFVPTDAAMPCVNFPIAGIFSHAAAVSAADALISDLTGVRGTVLFPDEIVAVADFGPTGMMVTFDIDHNGPTQKMYVTAQSPMIKFMKLAFYLGWIDALR
ncbi:NAD(P)/FAD-dependent oxidoreductase [Ignicoccus hospitalis]|uniref:FAD-dependent pyridine nucleotide-disulphide oxidoreductase n=1 Tax=Ignicoccus hospitalis (strain KIN4/I / DSM 18386 / JCM 14125) TaxID=453591 RepID=A8AAA3_IGNH4|nr:FAD-dependent oxidoreductase [Ignicoccus hospitalis]ABU81855.1 FAD-dependent pyridine nucleotide-disulphide oxidoreductase [Ignicoccus hospitalis KIN4/I]HIH90123.1 FAD-dependent oxidoreductase [Desulfurococcaceae archaeon]